MRGRLCPGRGSRLVQERAWGLGSDSDGARQEAFNTCHFLQIRVDVHEDPANTPAQLQKHATDGGSRCCRLGSSSSEPLAARPKSEHECNTRLPSLLALRPCYIPTSIYINAA
jgi:hypothetical protein